MHFSCTCHVSGQHPPVSQLIHHLESLCSLGVVERVAWRCERGVGDSSVVLALLLLLVKVVASKLRVSNGSAADKLTPPAGPSTVSLVNTGGNSVPSAFDCRGLRSG